MFLGGSYISEAVRTQLQLFLTAMLWGAAVGLAYDGLRILRRICGPPRWLYICEDILFWIAEALMIYRLMFQYDSGAIRSYTMFGMITGMALYLWIFGRWLVPLITRMIKAILKFFKKIFKGILKIFRILLKPFYRIFSFIGKKFLRKPRFIRKIQNYSVKLLKRKPKKGRMGVVENNTE